MTVRDPRHCWFLLPAIGKMSPRRAAILLENQRGESGARQIDGYDAVIGVSPPDEPDDPLHGFEGELPFREPDDRPPGERSLEVFLDVGKESPRPIVSAMNPNSALNFNKRF